MTNTLLKPLLALSAPIASGDPAEQLLDVAKTLIGKRRTPDHEPIPLKGLRVDPDYQRPPDRDKIAEFVKHVKAGGKLPRIKVNERPDGSRWITDGQHRAAAATLCGHDSIDAVITHVAQQDEPQETNIVTKVAHDADLEAIGLLLGAGAQRDGKRLVLNLGPAGQVSYVPHRTEWVAKTELGQLQVDARDARRVLDRLGLSGLSLETAIVPTGPGAERP